MNESPSPTISTVRGVLLGTLDQYAPDRPDQVWRLYNEASLPIDCLIPSAELLHSLLSQPLTTLSLQLAGWFGDSDAKTSPLPVLAAAWADDRPDHSLYHLPLDICPVEGTYMGILELIETIDTPPLYRMLWRVFREREIVARYWTMPASARHHHAFPGGLATHSREVALDLAGQAAVGPHERELCIAAGLLHDIGKVPDDEPELPHAIIGMKLAEKFKEKPEVCNAIGAHHDEVEMTSLIAPIIQVCDAISGARPGARREVVESYIKRLKEMEDIALSYPGVVKTYAIQAGRELRVIVGADKLTDQESEGLSHDIAKKIQDEMTYPGQVKITVIRETRAVSYAK